LVSINTFQLIMSLFIPQKFLILFHDVINWGFERNCSL
jgi:hypothetical protein